MNHPPIRFQSRFVRNGLKSWILALNFIYYTQTSSQSQVKMKKKQKCGCCLHLIVSSTIIPNRALVLVGDKSSHPSSSFFYSLFFHSIFLLQLASFPPSFSSSFLFLFHLLLSFSLLVLFSYLCFLLHKWKRVNALLRVLFFFFLIFLFQYSFVIPGLHNVAHKLRT